MNTHYSDNAPVLVRVMNMISKSFTTKKPQSNTHKKQKCQLLSNKVVINSSQRFH